MGDGRKSLLTYECLLSGFELRNFYQFLLRKLLPFHERYIFNAGLPFDSKQSFFPSDSLSLGSNCESLIESIAV